jgi:Fe-S cluster biogenesis protein NfuA
MAEDRGFRKQMERIESLLDEARQYSDGRARNTQELVQGLLDLHAAALERLLGTIAASGPQGLALIDTAARDELVGHVLLLYGLHPDDLETRVRQALDSIQPALQSKGGAVELLRVADGKVRVRLHGDWRGDVSPQMLHHTVEEAIYDTAPDVTAIAIDGVPVLPQVKETVGHARFALPLVMSEPEP